MDNTTIASSLNCGSHWSAFGDFVVSDTDCYVYLPYRTAINWALIVVGTLQLLFGARLARGWWPQLSYAAYVLPAKESHGTGQLHVPGSRGSHGNGGANNNDGTGATTPGAGGPGGAPANSPVESKHHAWQAHASSGATAAGPNYGHVPFPVPALPGVVLIGVPTTQYNSEVATPPHTTRGLSLPPPATPLNAIVRASLAAISTPPSPNHALMMTTTTANIARTTGTGGMMTIPATSPSNIYGAHTLDMPSTPVTPMMAGTAGLVQVAAAPAAGAGAHHPLVLAPARNAINRPVTMGGTTTGGGATGTGTPGVVSSVAGVPYGFAFPNPTSPQPSPPGTNRRAAVPGTPAHHHQDHVKAAQVAEAMSTSHYMRLYARRRRQQRIAMCRMICGCGHRPMEPALRAALHVLVHGCITLIIASVRLSDGHTGIGPTIYLSLLFGFQIMVFFHLLTRLSLDLLRIEVRWTTSDPGLLGVLRSAHVVIWVGFVLMCLTQFIIIPLAWSVQDQHSLITAYLIGAGICCSITNISVPYFSKRLGDRLLWAAGLSSISSAQQAERKRLAAALGGLWKPALPAAFICTSFIVAAFVPWIRTRTMYLMTAGQLNLSFLTIVGTTIYPSVPPKPAART